MWPLCMQVRPWPPIFIGIHTNAPLLSAPSMRNSCKCGEDPAPPGRVGNGFGMGACRLSACQRQTSHAQSPLQISLCKKSHMNHPHSTHYLHLPASEGEEDMNLAIFPSKLSGHAFPHCPHLGICLWPCNFLVLMLRFLLDFRVVQGCCWSHPCREVAANKECRNKMLPFLNQRAPT